MLTLKEQAALVVLGFIATTNNHATHSWSPSAPYMNGYRQPHERFDEDLVVKSDLAVFINDRGLTESWTAPHIATVCQSGITYYFNEFILAEQGMPRIYLRFVLGAGLCLY